MVFYSINVFLYMNNSYIRNSFVTRHVPYDSYVNLHYVIDNVVVMMAMMMQR